MLTYKQSTGEIFAGTGTRLGKGWAGQGPGQNNPDMQNIPNIGPLPQGIYKITAPYSHPHLGPYVMNLVPDPANEMFGRSSFRIHGAAYIHPELSSEGCIIQTRTVRETIWERGDHYLTVVG